MATVLVVDDDSHIREVVRFALEQGGFQVLEASDAMKAWRQFESAAPDLLVLDILMPEGDGLDVCRKVRNKGDTPIIFLSSKDTELDRVLGLEMGADDYLIKPFSPRELLARVKAVLRRRQGAGHESTSVVRTVGDLTLDPQRHRCTLQGQEIVLTVTEFALLESLLSSVGIVLTRDQLVDKAYGLGHVITERTVDSHIRRIRQKLAAAAPLGEELVETVYGIGYRAREQP
jgi:two-component system, OmpR family, response regulator